MKNTYLLSDKLTLDHIKETIRLIDSSFELVSRKRGWFENSPDIKYVVTTLKHNDNCGRIIYL